MGKLIHKSSIFTNFAAETTVRSIAVSLRGKRGKSGQHRAPYFLTGR